MVDKKQKKKTCCNCDDKSITYQIAMGVILTLVIIFLLLVLVISLNVYFLNNETEKRINGQLEGIYCKNLEDLGNEGAASIDVIRQITSKLLDKVQSVAVDIIEPGKNWPGGTYPLKFSTATVNTDPNPFKLTYTRLTPPVNITTQNIMKKLSILQTIWKNSLLLKMGPDRKIELSYIVFYFPDSNEVLVQGQLDSINTTRFEQLKTQFGITQTSTTKLFMKMLADPFNSASVDQIIGMFNNVTVTDINIKIATFYKQAAFQSMIKILEGDIQDDSLVHQNQNRNLQVLLFQKGSGKVIAGLVKTNQGLMNETKKLDCNGSDKTDPICSVLWSKTSPIIDCKPNGETFESKNKNQYYVANKTSPYEAQGTNYDFQLYLFQNKKELNSQLQSLSSRIQNDTILLTSLVLFVCLIVLALIGFIVIRYSRRISNPIQVLNKVVENIKKQSNRDDFYQLLRSEKIFERFEKEKENDKDEQKNYDEIDRLISIFYKFFVGVKEENRNQNQKDEDGLRDRLFVTKYKYYPNLYYNNASEEDREEFKNQEIEQEEQQEEKKRTLIEEEEQEQQEGGILQESKKRDNIYRHHNYLDDSQNLLQSPQNRQDSAEKKRKQFIGGSVELQEIDISQAQLNRDDEKEKQFDYAEDIEKTKKLIKKLTKSHKPIHIDWDELLKNVKDIENQNNRQIQNS